MKILMINDHGFESGGVSVYIVNLKTELEKRGHIIKILSSDENSENKHFSDIEYEGILNKNFIIRGFYRIFNPFSYFKTKKILHEFNPDIVHLHNFLNYGSPSILFNLKKIPTVMTIHDYYSVGLGYKITPLVNKKNKNKMILKLFSINLYYESFIKIFTNIMLKNINQFIAPSKSIKKDFESLGIKNITQIYHGIYLFDYSDIKNWNNLLYIGRLSNEKGVEYLIDSMNYIVKKFPSIHLNIIGDGPEKEYFKILVKKFNLSNNISFIGQISSQELENYYLMSTILIVPSIGSEAFGLVGPEAMSIGRPIIGTNIGAIPEWLEDNVTGYIVEPGNSKQISEKVIYLLSNKKLIKQMSKNARKKAVQFSIKKHIQEIENIYYKTIKEDLL